MMKRTLIAGAVTGLIVGLAVIGWAHGPTPGGQYWRQKAGHEILHPEDHNNADGYLEGYLKGPGRLP